MLKLTGKTQCVSDRPIKDKTRETRNNPGDSHQLAFSTFHSKPYLKNDEICKFLAKRINEADELHNFAVLAYVFMPDHVHLLIHPMDEIYDMSKILQAIKQGPSRTATNRKWISSALWEEGGGHDSNFSNAKERTHCITYIHFNPLRKDLVADPWDYRWSSANWYINEIECEVECHRMSEFFES